jgi:hypothetical protein
MLYLVLLFAEIVFLFFLSGLVTKNLSRFLSISLLSFIFLPGVIIHELSHLLIATILFVPVGDMEFAPRRDGDGLKLGSVKIAEVDPFRRSLIGFAPVFVGLLLVIGMVYLFNLNIVFLQKNPYVFLASIFILAYLLFAISNTMFSSKVDMRGAIEVLLTLLIILVGLYVVGFRLPLTYFNSIFAKELVGIVQKSALFLFAPIVIDLILLRTIKLFSGSRN